MKESPLRMRISINLKQLALAMHDYNDARGHLPGANGPYVGPKGAASPHPASWRVLILPYIEQQALFDLYRFDEPWDGPNNIELVKRMPRTFRHPKADSENVPAGHTHYRVFVSRPDAKPSALFTDGMPGPKLEEISDGMANTILIVEAAEAVPWTMPEVLLYDHNQPLPKLGGLFPGGYQAALADGSVKFFRAPLPDDKLRAWITKDGGETVDGDW